MLLKVMRVLKAYFYKTQMCINMASHHSMLLKSISSINKSTGYLDRIHVNSTEEL